MSITSALRSWHCAHQRIFLRADLNVPIHHGVIRNDQRLCAIQDTLDYLIDHQATVLLATHLGRPKDHEDELSTKHLMPWFEKKGYRIRWSSTFDDAAQMLASASPGSIVLLENLRFFKGELDASAAFAQHLAQLASFYVNDAFGTLHRNDTSITLLPELFASKKRTIGFLVEKELALLDTFLQKPAHPVLLILGGDKIATKLPLIKNLLPITDHIMLCPAIVFTFLKALDRPVGKSLVDDEVMQTALATLHQAPQENCMIHFPLDYQIAHQTIDGPLSIIKADQFPQDGVGISIGPATIAQWRPLIATSGTTFFNGAIGFAHRPETLKGMRGLLSAMAEGSGTSYVTGGDSIAMVKQLAITGIKHTITGGGSALAYLSSEELPGLKPFI